MGRDEADAEIKSSGRSFEELPSKLGKEIELALTGVSDLVQKGMARAMSRKKHDDSSGIDLTISPSSGDKKKKMKKKKQKPPKIHFVQPMMMPMKKMEDKGRGFGRVQTWVVGNVTGGKGRGFVSDVLNVGEKALDAVAEHVIEKENSENGLIDRSSVEEQRGKKKKKKKAILKLLILGAVLKAKIGTILQILSFKLQVKFFIIALIGLAINLARFWVELKNKHNQQPQKVIYYEHAQHQHHYEHEDEPGWGPWSRSMEPEETEVEVPENPIHNSPYRAYEKNAQVFPTRPLLTLS
ncbi:unnamed protein product, partial [Brenthis ino]